MASAEESEITDIPSPDSFFQQMTDVKDVSDTFVFPVSFADITSPAQISFDVDLPMKIERESSIVTSTSSNNSVVPSPESSSSASESDVPSSSVSSSAAEKSLSSLKYPPCVVCTGRSSGLHYGCYTCEACKNFFRRYLLRNDGFICKKNNNCPIINRSRGNCAGCRLKKCLDVGMSKEKSKIGRYTHAQRTETIREVNKLEGKAVEEDEESEKMGLGKNMKLEIKAEPIEQECLTKSDYELIFTLVDAKDAIEHFGPNGKTPESRMKIIEDHYEKYLAKVKLFGPLRAIPKDEYFTLLKMYNIDLEGHWSKFKKEGNNCQHIVQRYCEFAYKIPGFKDLNPKDQGNLLKYGHCDFFIILLQEGYVDEYKIFLEMNGVPSHLEEAADKIFSRELIEIQLDLYIKWQKLKLTTEEQALLIAMSIVSTDRCELDDPGSVEAIHTMLMELLMKLLRSKYGNSAEKRFSKFIDVLLYGRVGSEMYFKEYLQMSQNEMVTEAVPTFPALCPEFNS